MKKLASRPTARSRSDLEALRDAYVADLRVRTGATHVREVERVLKAQLPPKLDRITLEWAMGLQQSLGGLDRGVDMIAGDGQSFGDICRRDAADDLWAEWIRYIDHLETAPVDISEGVLDDNGADTAGRREAADDLRALGIRDVDHL